MYEFSKVLFKSSTMGKTRAECSQNAYTSHASAFLTPLNTNFSKFFAQIWHVKKKKKKKKNDPVFRILRSVGRGQHNNFFFLEVLII